MFEHMTMHHISLSLHVKRLEQSSIIFGEFHPDYCHVPRHHVNGVPEYFLIGFGKLIITSPVSLRIHGYWWFCKSMAIGSSSVDLKVFLSVSLDVKGKLLNFLAINQVDMYWVHVWGQVDNVKIVSFSNLESTVGTVHSVHH